VREVSDSLHLRRFCLIALGERVPHESTVRKLTRRLGGDVVEDLTRFVIAKAQRETRFRARAVRIDSTVVEGDVRYPSDAALSLDGARTLAREARKLTGMIGKDAGLVRDRSRALGRRLRAISRTMGRRTGERKEQVLALTDQAGQLLRHSIREARRLALTARRRARGRGAQRKLAAIARLEQTVDLAERVATQIKLRIEGKPISDRLVSMFDPDARPIRKGKLGKPNEFGYVFQICEVTPKHAAWGTRIHPAGVHSAGQPAREQAPARHDRRAGAARAQATRYRARWRLREGPNRPSARAARAGAGIHRRPSTAGLQTHAKATRPIPDRSRGQDQPPQAQLRIAPLPPEGSGRSTRLERVGDPRLQP